MEKKEQLKILDEKIEKLSKDVDKKIEEFRISISEGLNVLRREREKLYKEATGVDETPNQRSYCQIKGVWD